MKRLFLSALLVSPSFFLFAQQTKITTDPDQAFLQARTDFYAQQYGLAYPVFQKIKKEQTASSQVNNYLRSQELDFFNIASALMLREDGADLRAKNYMTETNNSVLEPQLNYYLGSYYFSKANFADAANAFEQSSIANLTNEQIAQKNFEEGYSWFTQQQFAKAKPLLNSVRQIPTDKNYVDANYYYGFIAFSDKNYRDALESFQLVQSRGRFLNLVPFYITQIYYFQGQKEKAIAEAEKALQRGGQYYELELSQLLGHAYFEKQEYAKALPLLEKYVTASSKVRKEDLYELSFCYYQAGQLTKAIEGFKQLSSGQDTLSQNAMYLLGDAYLKTGQKKEARNAFLFCSTNSSNQKQKEISTFLLGKLSYELGYDNEALIALKKYNDVYFRGEFADECRELLVNVLANTNNYRDALTLYETLPNKSENNKRVYPRILYNRAQELTNDDKLIESDKLLEKAEKSEYNSSLLPLIHFWRGEIAFRADRLTDATNQLNSYLRNPMTEGEANASNANYILGYAAMRNEDYRQALQYFQQVKNVTAEQDIDIQNRMADCYYMLKDFNRANELYNSVISRKTGGSDYATYQKAMIAGAQNRTAEKISLMRSIETVYPSSTFYGDAQMEAANAYLAAENFKDALPFLEKIIKGTNTESLKPQAYLKTGIAQYNLDKDNDALNTFKTLLQKYPQSAEAEDAIENIRNIFIGQGKPDEYVKFIKSTGKNISYGEADSLTYTAANLQLSNGNKDKALDGFTKYLSQYPDGQYVVNASYYAAELLEEKKDIKNAIARYQFVADKAPNKFAERSMLIVARYYYFEMKDYAAAASYYQKLKDYSTSQENKLEARRGLLRCQYQLAQWAEALPNAQEILATKSSGADDKIFAYMIVGKNAQSQNDCAAAITAFKSVASLSKAAYGAEARYEIANCLFQQNKLADAEKAAFEVINKAGSYVDWVTRSYLLLGDIYLKQKDYFNAKATYKSVAENATIAEFKTAAQNKYKIAEDEEAKSSKVGG
ncbi:MAG: tetratricopeptide repeat protein [Bacteroidota bacterium]